jgi:hypothetical protein
MANSESTKAKVLAAVPEDGTAIGNKRLRESLSLGVRAYQAAVDELIEDGELERWRGRGGTVRRTGALAAWPKPAKTPVDEAKAEQEASNRSRVLESKLYPPFLESLKLWANEQGWTQHVVNQIANQGSKKTGGTWTRPDFVVVGYRKFEYTPGIVRDVETFEIKPSTCGIEAVFETASHSRVATKSFLAIHLTDDGPDQDLLGRIEAECVRFGIGLIVFTDPKNYDTWDYKVEPSRSEPDPFDLEEFIRIQVPTADQERIRKWLR